MILKQRSRKPDSIITRAVRKAPADMAAKLRTESARRR